MVFETIVSAIPPLRRKAKYSILGLLYGPLAKFANHL